MWKDPRNYTIYSLYLRLCDLHDYIDSKMNSHLCTITQSVLVGDYVIAKFPVDER